MMKRILLSALLFPFFMASALSQREDEIYTFEPSEEAERIVKEIMGTIGLLPNFVLKAADVKNALATVQGDKRYILYSNVFLEKFKADANTKWAAYLLLAHEIGHHLNGHNFSETDPKARKRYELEADKFSGSVLRSLGASLEESLAGIKAMELSGETLTQPPKSARLEAVASGWKARNELLGDLPSPTTAKITLTPKIWAVIVGIERYEQAVMPLQYAKSDAYEFSQYLQSVDGLSLPKKQVRLLTDYQASKQKILINLKEQFDNAGPEDMVIFYFSGHGAEQAFIPQDYTGSELSKLPHSEIREIFSKCKAKHKLIISDACYSGSFKEDKDTGSPADIMNKYNQSLLESKGGLAILTSSKENEKSKEVDGKQQGVFSYHIVQGLMGEADKDDNKIVTITELFDYVYLNTQRDTGYRQTPVLSGKYDKNMPVGIVKK